LLQGRLRDLRKADVFSLGATLYELLRWQPLPTGGDEYHAIRNGSLEFGSEVPAELATAVWRMMQPEPSRRPTVAELLQLPVFSGYSHPGDLVRITSLAASTEHKLAALNEELVQERRERLRLLDQLDVMRSARKEAEEARDTLAGTLATVKANMEALGLDWSSAVATSPPTAKTRRVDAPVTTG